MTSNVVVQKYGGSSLADVAHVRQVAQLVAARARQGAKLVVVVSAMGDTTDALLAQAAEISATPCQRELDMLVTAGERVSMALLSMAVQEAGVPAISFTGSQTGIITECNHQGARILEIRPQRVQQALAKGAVVIVAGFQGVSRAREVTTLGRGGSDTTAVALAAALGAPECEIYSDVDGVYSADPRLCSTARHLPELSYQTMLTMAQNGAQVLHAEAVVRAREAGVRIVARRTSDGCAPGSRETRVDGHAGEPDGAVAVVRSDHATASNVSSIVVVGGRLSADGLREKRALERLTGRLGESDRSVEPFCWEQVSARQLRVVVPQTEAAQAVGVLHDSFCESAAS